MEKFIKYREITKDEVLSAAFTLLTKLDVVTVEEVRMAKEKDGYSGVWDLLDDKYKKLVEDGVIQLNK